MKFKKIINNDFFFQIQQIIVHFYIPITEKTEAYELDIKTNRPKSTNPLLTKSLHHHRHAHGHLFSHILEPLVEQDTVRRHSIDTSPRLSAVGS